MDQYLEFISNHYLLVLALAAVTFLLIQDLVESSFNKFTSISPMIAVTKMNSDDTVIVDVREPHEYIKGHIENSLNIPLGKLDEQLPTLEAYKKNPLIVVCQSGTRSVPACKTLTKAGFEEIYNITGGMQSWEDNKLPMKITSKNKD
ncbi:rhodanese-like domain-containing protein [Methylomarinum vadi]|uniref:rhodanese-like domain-containing protein n=1 Tax=Methylomarinum vadi TaxID=438855 RepID=UPI0004DFC525|nr:rhodanese-like domain-containing protein [Methylomarinum vadi]